MKLNIPLLTDEKNLLVWVKKLVDQLREHIDGAGLGFGNMRESTTDNIAGVWIFYTTNAVADTEDVITHNLGVVPSGFLVFAPSKPGVIYYSGTPWTTTQIFLKCNQASMDVNLFIVAPSNQQS